MRYRLDCLKGALKAVARSQSSQMVAGIRLLCSLFVGRQAPLANLALAFPDQQTGYWDWAAIESGQHPVVFGVKNEVVRKFAEIDAQAEQEEVVHRLWHFDVLLIHEVLHGSQGLRHGLYKRLKTQAPNLLNALDDDADAISVLSLFELIRNAPEFYFGECPKNRRTHGQGAVS